MNKIIEHGYLKHFLANIGIALLGMLFNVDKTTTLKGNWVASVGVEIYQGQFDKGTPELGDIGWGMGGALLVYSSRALDERRQAKPHVEHVVDQLFLQMPAKDALWIHIQQARIADILRAQCDSIKKVTRKRTC